MYISKLTIQGKKTLFSLFKNSRIHSLKHPGKRTDFCTAHSSTLLPSYPQQLPERNNIKVKSKLDKLRNAGVQVR